MLQLTLGQIIRPDELVGRLLSQGYEPEFSANSPGQFARRGGIVDIFPANHDYVFRLEFKDNAIEDIQSIKQPFEFAQGRESKTKQQNNVTILKNTSHAPREKLRFISALKPGDYVVHIDHGIGQFSGLKNQTIDGLERDYLELTYAENDKLFVPVESADRVDRYLGSQTPTLHRLSGSSWFQATALVKDGAKKFAENLLRLYAKRAIARAQPLLPHPEEKNFAAAFPFDETTDQTKAIAAVLADLERIIPMDRLIAGDVGFGKTEVAFRAGFRAVKNKKQVILLCPTTILAQQHTDTAQARLEPFGAHVAGLSRVLSKNAQQKTVADWNAGKIDFLIGTHRLLSGDLSIKNTGLLIIDEEQKFGVKQKELFKHLRHDLHTLILSATPIPRTLYTAVSELKDMSVIQTPPLKRRRIETQVAPYNESLIRVACQKELARGGQIYYLWNRVETINAAAQQLQKILTPPPVSSPSNKLLLPLNNPLSSPLYKGERGSYKEMKGDYKGDVAPRIAVLHGQLPEEEISATMHGFDIGEIDILVCSTIIENGLDLPNVNTLIAPDALRFGLSQLYQIRGRIGRGERQAYAYILYPRSKLSPLAKTRLETIQTMTHLGAGLEVALQDMELRGVGSVLSKKQHGHVKNIGLNLYLKLLEEAIFELKTGIERPPATDPVIDLPLSAGIPASVIPDLTERTCRYIQLASVDSLAILEQEKNKLCRPGCPERLQNLFFVLRVKILARLAGLLTARVALRRTGAAAITLETAKPWRPEQIDKLLAHDEEWTFNDITVKRLLENQQEEWKKILEEGIKKLTF